VRAAKAQEKKQIQKQKQADKKRKADECMREAKEAERKQLKDCVKEFVSPPRINRVEAARLAGWCKRMQ